MIDDLDRPVRRRLHRTELEHARTDLTKARGIVVDYTAELGEIEGRLPHLEAAVADAQATYRTRPRVERERHAIGRVLDRDIAARAPSLAADPPDYLMEHLGRRPDRGVAADLWDEAAGRIGQHRTAFDVADTDNILGRSTTLWEDSPFTASRREASEAWDRLDRSLGRGLEIEPPGLDLGLSL